MIGVIIGEPEHAKRGGKKSIVSQSVEEFTMILESAKILFVKVITFHQFCKEIISGRVGSVMNVFIKKYHFFSFCRKILRKSGLRFEHPNFIETGVKNFNIKEIRSKRDFILTILTILIRRNYLTRSLNYI